MRAGRWRSHRRRTPRTGRRGRWPGRAGMSPVRGLADLAGVRPQAAPGRDAGSCRPTRCSSTRSATSSGCTWTRPSARWCSAWTRRSQIQALDRTAPILPMLPGTPGAADPRLHPPRHHQPVRRARRGHRQGHRPDCTPPPRDRVHAVPEDHRRRRPQRPRPAPGPGQLRHPQDPAIQQLARCATPASTCTSRPPAAPGSTSSNAGSPSSPPKLRRCAHRSVAELERRHPRLDRRPGTTTPNPSSGPRPPTRSSKPSPLLHESTTQDTSGRAARRQRSGSSSGSYTRPCASKRCMYGTM